MRQIRKEPRQGMLSLSCLVSVAKNDDVKPALDGVFIGRLLKLFCPYKLIASKNEKSKMMKIQKNRNAKLYFFVFVF